MSAIPKHFSLFILFLVIGLTAPAALAAGPQASGCGDAAVTYEVAEGIELTRFECSMGKYKNLDSLHFTVEMKNTADAPQRFRVNIFTDSGKAVGGLVPRKTKKGLVEPGQTAEYTYPIKGLTETPQKIDVLVRPIAAD